MIYYTRGGYPEEISFTEGEISFTKGVINLVFHKLKGAMIENLMTELLEKQCQVEHRRTQLGFVSYEIIEELLKLQKEMCSLEGKEMVVNEDIVPPTSHHKYMLLSKLMKQQQTLRVSSNVAVEFL